MTVKMVFCVRKRDELSKEEFHRYWKENHGALIRSLAKDLGASKYVQSHLIDTPVNASIMGARGMTAEPYDGITEIWWDSMEKLIEFGLKPEGQAAAEKYVSDEATFIDFAQSRLFMAEEHTVFDLSDET